MFSTPLICSSMGATTVEATTSALAPGYWPVTLIIGGAISGYCATGSRAKATRPRITNTIERTEAKIGRSMKKREMDMGLFGGLFGFRRAISLRFDVFLLRRHFGALPRRHQTIDDHAIAGLDSVLDHAQIADKLAEGHVFLPRHVLGIDDKHVFPRLFARDCCIRDQQGRIGR